ncbi:IS66 family insertion sequence element accessory protein TnpA [Schlesneria sp. T3-172]|uniref:IS66 family insertion sequence element accessory protein TnpA n=1 Tax=Schlesneria sphaerica TaxID=3373610 RepID=UPI0037C93225
MSQVGSRSREKESYWRSHWERQSSSGESIRGYCRRRGLSEATFHYWRRQLSSLDQELTVRRTTDPQVTRPQGTGMACVPILFGTPFAHGQDTDCKMPEGHFCSSFGQFICHVSVPGCQKSKLPIRMTNQRPRSRSRIFMV